MAIPDNTVIYATVDASSADFILESGQTATINAVGLSSGEEVTLSMLAGDTYVPCYDFDLEAALSLTSTKTPLSIRSPGYYRLSKPITAQAVSVHLNK